MIRRIFGMFTIVIATMMIGKFVIKEVQSDDDFNQRLGRYDRILVPLIVLGAGWRWLSRPPAKKS